MTNRYTIERDNDTESFKIIDTGTFVGTEDIDYEWVASAYDFQAATHISNLLNKFPHAPTGRKL